MQLGEKSHDERDPGGSDFLPEQESVDALKPKSIPYVETGKASASELKDTSVPRTPVRLFLSCEGVCTPTSACTVSILYCIIRISADGDDVLVAQRSGAKVGARRKRICTDSLWSCDGFEFDVSSCRVRLS
ncbi:Hypothetical protein SMAX5B_003077 [Scophthalmus maximus]|uniref:Uncharacterized protein n=1 Tax=Scophthalmus maximus TaxID=52904 RepID=A0A2U9BNU2_SCOMX|nr:Hypothetical protein SMAX5B_003077 [Scophthalmus maximus]